MYPALFSHHTNQNGLVVTILQDGIELALRNRLTSTAIAELASLNSLLQDCALSQVPDDRRLLNGAAFSTKGAYAALSDHLSDPMLNDIWDSMVPKKVMIFGWLFYLDRLNTRKNLHKKNILDSSACPRCTHSVEDRQHLFLLVQQLAGSGEQPASALFTLLSQVSSARRFRIRCLPRSAPSCSF